MAFDLSTAQPVGQSSGFDLSTAQPVGATGTVETIRTPAGQAIVETVETPQAQAGMVTGQGTEGEFSFARYLEPAATIATGALAEVPAGIAGIVQAANPFAEEGAGTRAIEATREALTYVPRTEEGQAALQAVGETVAPVAESISAVEKGLGDFAFELTGSPAIAAGATALPAAAMEALGLGAVRKIRPGTRLLDDAGNPTKALEKALDNQGLSFEGLSDATKADIPAVAPKPIIPRGAAGEAAGPAEQALAAQIQAGATDPGLARFKVQAGRILPDKLASEAIRQGYPDGFVQAVKVATPETRAAMRRMLNMRQRIQGNQRLALDFRPSDVIGDSVNRRISYIRSAADDARKELNTIARERFPGKQVDTQGISDALQESFDDLDIDLKQTDEGLGEPDFKGSMISKDRSSQRVIKDAIDLLQEVENPDALRLHKLKRQLDTMIDFRKRQTAGGLSEAGKNTLKNLRYAINQTLRDVDPDYARVNDVLSGSLTALDDFQRVAGPSIDIMGEGSAKAIGQDLRGLLSNRKTRVRLDNAVRQLDDTATELGGQFGDDVRDLTLFAEGLEDRFGSVAATSFEREIQSATEQALTQGVRETVTQAAAKKAGEAVERARGINDVNAFRAMRQLLGQ